MSKLDERGSVAQHFFYNLLSETYPKYEVIYEYPIGALSGQRIDLFIPALGIAVEYDGVQHEKYNSFFFKDENSWNNSVMLDKKKDKYLKDHGVKVVRIPHNTKIKTAAELKAYIDNVSYPDEPYSEIPKESEYQLKQKEDLKDKRRKFKQQQKERQNSNNN